MESIFKHFISRMVPLYERKCEEGRTRRGVSLVYFLTISNLECAHSNVGSGRCFKTCLSTLARLQKEQSKQHFSSISPILNSDNIYIYSTHFASKLMLYLELSSMKKMKKEKKIKKEE